MKNVAGKVAFITGGSSGVGLGILRTLTAAGMKAAFTYRRAEHLEQALRFFEGTRDAVLPIHLDVTDRAAMALAADKVYETYGGVDLLVNNAAVNMFSPMDKATYDDWDWLIDVNLRGVINGLVTFLPRMQAAGRGGHIVNTASMGAFIAGPGAGIYTTTKFAVRGLTESLRYCLAEHGIGVSLLCPGLVVSNIHKSHELRPRHYSSTSSAPPSISADRLEQIQQLGLDPLDVGKMTLQGIINNDAYIFTHPDHKEELRESFARILRAIPDGEVDLLRAGVEAARRKRITDIEALISNMDH